PLERQPARAGARRRGLRARRPDPRRQRPAAPAGGPMIQPLVATRRLPARHGALSLACGAHSFTVSAYQPGVYLLEWQDARDLPDSPAALPPTPGLEGLEARVLPDGWRLFDDDVAIRLYLEPLGIEFKTAAGESIWGPFTIGLDPNGLVLEGPLAGGD